MKKISRVMLFLLIFFIMFATSFANIDSQAAVALAEVEDLDQLKAAITAAPAADSIDLVTIQLKKNIDITEKIEINNKKFKLDLNGFKLQLNPGSPSPSRIGHITLNNSNFILCDESTSSTGMVCGGNVGGSYGGAFDVNGGTFTLQSGIITDNKTRYGGGVSVTGGGTFIMNGGYIEENYTNESIGGGAGVYVSGSGSKFILNGGVIRGNMENGSNHICGGGVYVDDNAIFTMNGGKIGDENVTDGANSITGKGAGVYVNNATFNFVDGSIENNVTSTDGGGIYLDTGSTFTMSSGKIYKNLSSYAGSAIYINNATSCNINGGKINYNTSTNNVGAIYISEDSTKSVKISGVEITENNLGGIYNKGKDVTLENVTIKNNTCADSGYGAGVYDDGNLKLVGKNYIYDNKDTSGSRQANIYLTDGTLLEIPSDLPDETKIGVWSDAAKPVKVTKDYGNKANANWQIQPEKYFFSDRDDYFAQKTPNDPTDHEVYLMQPKHTHSISNVSAEGDCITNGIKDHIECTECGRFFDDTTGALEIEVYDVTADKNSSKHVGEAKYARETIDVEPTCTKAGSKTIHYNCDKCNGEMKTEKVEIPALGHKFGPWTIIKNPTKDADGVEERTCKVCGEKETRPVKYNGKDATEKANNVPTGDNNPVIPLALVMIFSLLNSICIMIIKKNTNN